MTNIGKKQTDSSLTLLTSGKSELGEPWVPIYKTNVDFRAKHFEAAMSNLIKQPNINSTVILRADILKENIYDPEKGDSTFVSKLINEYPEFPPCKIDDQLTKDSKGEESKGSQESKESQETKESQDTASDFTIESESNGETKYKPSLEVLSRNLDDISFKPIPALNPLNLVTKYEIIRRIIPRNPYKDHIINQTCLVLTAEGSVLVVYIPHISKREETPFYLPPVYGVGILYHNSTLSIHYLPFNYDNKSTEGPSLRELDSSERPIRIALRLLQTSSKHSLGAKTGYEKRVNHDLVVPKISFQNRYISLKKKYSSNLVNLWCESTDPKKHVFEDLAIAAFLIEYWNLRYPHRDIEFRDLGCGNGLLVYILNMEGYKGKGMDARARKSWSTYPQEVQNNLLEQIVIPSILLKPHPAVRKIAPNVTDNGRVYQVPEITTGSTKEVPVSYHTSASLLKSSQICTTEEFPSNTFIIGNHSDELTCWIPLLGFPFIVIPCCSHALSGSKMRYSPRKRISTPIKSPTKSSTQNISAYSTLVDHVEDLSTRMGWITEKEMLRIPSTRNAAILSTKKFAEFEDEDPEINQTRVLDILALEGGAEGWVENSMALMKKSPRNH